MNIDDVPVLRTALRHGQSLPAAALEMLCAAEGLTSIDRAALVAHPDSSLQLIEAIRRRDRSVDVVVAWASRKDADSAQVIAALATERRVTVRQRVAAAPASTAVLEHLATLHDPAVLRELLANRSCPAAQKAAVLTLDELAADVEAAEGSVVAVGPWRALFRDAVAGLPAELLFETALRARSGAFLAAAGRVVGCPPAVCMRAATDVVLPLARSSHSSDAWLAVTVAGELAAQPSIEAPALTCLLEALTLVAEYRDAEAAAVAVRARLDRDAFDVTALRWDELSRMADRQPQLTAKVSAHLSQEFGDRPQLWSTAAALMPSFRGTVADLVTTVRSIAAGP